MKKTIIAKMRKAPLSAGIYEFLRKNKTIYIGKASNLRSRLKSYLSRENFKSKNLRKEADDIKIIPLSSNVEALIQESILIKKKKPKFNVMMADDKTYFYVMFTREKFPKIFIAHHSAAHLKRIDIRPGKLIGPFTEGSSLKTILRLLRRIFPYCTCTSSHLRTCLNAQIGNCLDFCCRKNAHPNAQEIKQYRKNIAAVKNFLLGKTNISKYPSLQRNIKALENVMAHSDYLQIEEVADKMPEFKKVETYDISHLSGKETVGAMTAWVYNPPASGWEPNKNLWRKFRIRSAPRHDDPRAIAEVIERRFNHPEWPFPDLVIIDGGKTQLNAAKKALSSIPELSTLNPPLIISLAKPGKLIHGLSKNPIPLANLEPSLRKIVELSISQTHRFVLRYHRKIRAQNFN